MSSRARVVAVAVVCFPLAVSSALAQEGKFSIDPDALVVCAGKSVTVVAKNVNDNDRVDWKIVPDKGRIANELRSATYTAPEPDGSTVTTGVVTLTATLKRAGQSDATASTQMSLGGSCQMRFGGETVRATLGLEQIGAAGTASDQKYSFDFFISRPLPFGSHQARRPPEVTGDNRYYPPITDDEFYFGARLRWWGDVRVGSYPQQINSDLATFGSEFPTNAGKVTVNKLVQSAEFMTGPEVRIGAFTVPHDSATEAVRERFALMLFAGIGSIGPFPPGDNPAVFMVPAAPAGNGAPSPQYTAFHTAYPTVNSKYVSFVPEDHLQFSKQWSAGLRLYTFYADTSATSQPLAKAPASVEIGFGRNELVAPDSGMTWNASAYYPFALGDRAKPETLILYFFGDVNMRFKQATASTPIFLAPAVDGNNTAIPLTNLDVMIVSVPSNRRDTYRVGVSVDLIRIWNKLKAPSPPASSSSVSGQ